MAANGLTPLPPLIFYSYICIMIRKKIKRLDFKTNSLKHIFYIEISDNPSIDREYMEWFMREVQRSLRIPPQYFNTENNEY